MRGRNTASVVRVLAEETLAAADRALLELADILVKGRDAPVTGRHKARSGFYCGAGLRLIPIAGPGLSFCVLLALVTLRRRDEPGYLVRSYREVQFERYLALG